MINLGPLDVVSLLRYKNAGNWFTGEDLIGRNANSIILTVLTMLDEGRVKFDASATLAILDPELVSDTVFDMLIKDRVSGFLTSKVMAEQIQAPETSATVKQRLMKIAGPQLAYSFVGKEVFTFEEEAEQFEKYIHAEFATKRNNYDVEADQFDRENDFSSERNSYIYRYVLAGHTLPENLYISVMHEHYLTPEFVSQLSEKHREMVTA